MQPMPSFTFDAFRLEPPPGGLWRGDTRIALRARSLAVLRYLVAHAGRLVTKAELRQHVWGGAHVTDTVLRVCVREIRATLGDTVAAPQYLETVAQQGYRFRVVGDTAEPPPLTAGPIVGRQRDVTQLEDWFQRAAHGTRQLVFVSGDVGIGKTTVVDLFLARLAAGHEVRSGRGQCVEHYGEGEPYLPFLEALWQLASGPARDTLLAVLRQYAPLWLVQLPGLVSDTELERLQRQVVGATPARMLRELAQVLEVLTADTPLVLVLEDLQWSDRSTVDLLAYLAQRREPARLLVLGTYRPVDVVLQAHPLHGIVQELRGRGLARELPLELLPAEDVAAYLEGGLLGPVAPPLVAFVHERTDGHALFMVNLVEHLVQQGLVVRREGQWTLRGGAETAGLPEGLQQLLMRRIEALPPAAQQVLEAASVAGRAFPVATVAAATQCPVADVEAVCAGLAAQQHFLDDTGLTDWPDGTSGGSYRFRHVLYQQVLYERLGPTQRMQLHRRIGARLEAGYGARTGDIAVQLAVHYERGGTVPRAVHYWQQAGENAARCKAHHEAMAALTQGLTLLATLPDTPERQRHELTLLLTLGGLQMAVQGFMAPEVGETYTRAQALCHQVGEAPQRFQALWGLVMSQIAQGWLRTARELSQHLFPLAQCQPDTGFVLESHLAVGGLAFYHGDFRTARTHLEHNLRLADTRQPTPAAPPGAQDPRITALAWLVQTLWALGYADQAQQRRQEVLALARQMEQTPSLVYAELFTTLAAQHCGDVPTTHAHAEAVMALATAQGVRLRVAQGRLLRGWARAMQGDAAAGVVDIRQGLTVHQGTGTKLYCPYILALLAEAYGQAGQPQAGLEVLAEALALTAETEERWWEAELYRLQGTLLLQLPRPDIPQVEACFQQALDVARRQQAKSLELRAALSLSRLWQQHGKRQAVHTLLTPIYGWFTEGFDTADLQEAKVLLEAGAAG